MKADENTEGTIEEYLVPGRLYRLLDPFVKKPLFVLLLSVDTVPLRPGKDRYNKFRRCKHLGPLGVVGYTIITSRKEAEETWLPVTT